MASKTTAISANPVRHNRFGMHQTDLFAGGVARSAVGAPEWRELPKEAQDALVELMTPLVLRHARVSAMLARRTVMISDKVRPHHLERKAILYVRQSFAHQFCTIVRAARCNTRCDRLTALRAGFERMVAEVCLGTVGQSVRRRSCASRATAGIGNS
ncbi:hypothetical protein [Bradyrhizobium sp. BRP22]|uniref:hypothetical protein n=1 Tax=Bradyrhizobium sp. BRP22 TaxID=2793821 RepID=UPI001CD77009|nr:hypothetical protein [Bradyrhizobium sp. BRP22]